MISSGGADAPAEFRQAATVLLVRDSVDGPEVYMVQRPGRSADFPDLHVFPGGKVDPADAHVDPVGMSAADADRILGTDSGGLAYWVAAIRECFEECGVLLAYRETGAGMEYLSDERWQALAGYRAPLMAGELTMAEFLSAEGLHPALDHLLYFSHWITPLGPPRRFDTRFFVAPMPAAQNTDRHRGETASSSWISPQAALDRFAAGRWQMIMPTLTTLRSIVGYRTVEDVLAVVRNETHLPPLTDQLHSEGMQPFR